MKQFLIFSILFISQIYSQQKETRGFNFSDSEGQYEYVETKKVTEKFKGFKGTKKKYSVLKKNIDVKHGAYKEYYKRDLVVSGQYEFGKKNGTWIYRSPSGLYLQEINFVDGRRVGVSKSYFDGVLIYDAVYGQRSNMLKLKTYDFQDRLIDEFSYDGHNNQGKGMSRIGGGNGFRYELATYSTSSKLHGIIKVLYPTGELLQKKEYYKGKLIWASDVYKKNGEVQRKISFKNGTGKLVTYDFKKLIEEDVFLGTSSVSYKDSIPNGVYIAYNNEGEMLAKGRSYKNHRRGTWQIYSDKDEDYYTKEYKKISSKDSLEIFKETYYAHHNVLDVGSDKNNIKSPVLFMKDANSKKKNIGVYREVFQQKLKYFILDNLNLKKLKALEVKEEEDPFAVNMFRAVIYFNVNSLGEVVKLKVNSNHKILKEEIEKAMKRMPTLVPAFKNKHFVNSSMFILPIVLKF